MRNLGLTNILFRFARLINHNLTNMKNKFLLFLSFILYGYSISYSQSITVKGKITDNNGQSLFGVNIKNKQSNKGVSSDAGGVYNIDAKKGDVLVFSYIGFATQEQNVSGSTMNILLKESEGKKLDEVVVTAFGVSKKSKTLAYSSQQIKTKDLKTTGQTNILEAIQGQVSGVNISRASGGAGGGIDILIRGVTSLNPSANNQPLIILDGNPLNNDTFVGNVLPSTGSNSPSSAEQASFSSRLGDINQDDIESINILKGSGATALYGIKGANGVIIITTKKGKAGKMKISLSSSVTFSDVNKFPELQSRWREGTTASSGAFPRVLTPRVLSTNANTASGISFYPSYSSGFQSFGPAYSASDDASIHFRNFYKDFFKTGSIFQNNLTLSGSKDKISYYLSASTSNEAGIVPNTDFNRKTLKVSGNYDVTDNFSFGTSVIYTNSGGKMPNSGDKSIMSSLSYWSPSIDINDYLTANGKQKNYSSGIIDNPRYYAETSNLSSSVDRWNASINALWKLNSWLKVNYTASIDNYTDYRNRFVPADLDLGTQTKGFIVNQNIRFKGLNSNLLVTAEKRINDDFNNSLTIGNQVDDTQTNWDMIRGEGLNLSNFNNISNTTNLFQGNSESKKRIVGYFADYKLDFKDAIFLSLTARSDKASSLPKDNNTFQYYSAGLSALFANWLDSNKKVLSYGKARASIAGTGNVPDAGSVGRYFYSDSNLPFNGNGGFVYGTTLGDPNLLPEQKKSYELGVDLGFFNDRIFLEYTYYKNVTSNQILPVQVSVPSGISRFISNAGEIENIGHEVLLKADIIKKENISWKSTLSWSANKGKVVSLPNQINNLTFIDSGPAGVVSQVRVGDAPGTFYGYTWKYVGDKLLLVNGLPVVDASNVDKRKIVGNAFPDWVASLNNLFKYKNISLAFLLEYKKGGEAYDAGQRNGIRNGVLAITDERNIQKVIDGVMETSTGSGVYVPNTVSTIIDANYYRNSNAYNTASEILIQDASWVKLRNVSLSYSLSNKVAEKLKLENLSFSVSGSNFLLWTPFRGFDPEGNQYSAGSNAYGFTGLNIPLTQSYSFGINVGF